MEILSSIVVGAVAGGLAAAVCRSANVGLATVGLATSVAVGILGGLLGLASDFWLGPGGMAQLAFSEYLASGLGALLTLVLWIAAQRLFFSNSPESATND